MSGIVRTNDDTAGGTIRPSQTFAKINGQPIGIIGCPVDPHDPCWVPDPPHCAAVMAQGSAIAKINGIPICRAGDQASCGHPATGQEWARIAA